MQIKDGKDLYPSEGVALYTVLKRIAEALEKIERKLPDEVEREKGQ